MVEACFWTNIISIYKTLKKTDGASKKDGLTLGYLDKPPHVG
jgi:hypothetical protein